MGASAAAGPGSGVAEAADTPTLSVVLHKQTRGQDRGGDSVPYILSRSLHSQCESKMLWVDYRKGHRVMKISVVHPLGRSISEEVKVQGSKMKIFQFKQKL